MNPLRSSYVRRPAIALACALVSVFYGGSAAAQVPADFRITELKTTGAALVEHNAATGDDRGGIVVSPDYVLVRGDSQVGRFSAADVSGGTGLGVTYDGLCSNLRNEKIYTFALNGVAVEIGLGSDMNELREINPATGAMTGDVISLSQTLSLGYNSYEQGFFSGWDRVVLVSTASGSSVAYDINLNNGQVTNLGAVTLNAFPAESWACWGIAEYWDNQISLVYVQYPPSFYPAQTIVRNTLGGSITTLQSFTSLGDMASISFSTSRNRWYFHHEGNSQFGGFSESVGFADATWEGLVLPDEEIVATTQPLTVSEGLTGGGEIYRPFPGVINAANRVAFKAFGAVGTGALSGSNDSLLLTDTSGDLHVIAREGAIVDASPVTTLHGLFTGLLLTESGQSVAFDRIKGSSASRDQAYFTSTDGETLEILSRTGDSAAGGGLFKSPGGAFVADSDNRIYFSATLSGAGVNAKNDSGLWQEDAGTQTLIAREGSDVSSLTTDAAWLGFVQPRLSAGGDGVAFVAGLQNNPANRREKTDSTKNEVVLDGNEAGLSLILRKGDVVADAGGAVLNRLLGVSRSGTGSHAVLGLLKSEGAVTRLNDAVLLAVSGGTVNLVAREGVTLVGGSTVRQVLEYHAIGDDEVIFLTDRALCRWTVADGIVVLGRTGAAAPGAGSNFTRLAAVSVSEGGAVALIAQLADGKTGLWRALPGGALGLVLRSGDATTVDGSAETILAFAIHRSAGTVGAGGGAGAAINDAGTIFATLSVGDGVHVARRFYP